MRGGQEEFAIAVAAENGRGRNPDDLPSQRHHEGGDVGTDGGLDRGIAHDAFFEGAPAGLELRLDERKEARGKTRHRKRRRQNELEGDEAHVDAYEVRGPVLF